MFHYLDRVAAEFRLADWRSNVAYRRNLIRAAALTAIDQKLVQLTQLIGELKLIVHYRQMSKRDRGAFDQSLHYLRRIVEGWHRLDGEDRDAFRRGEAPPWRIFKRLATLSS